VAEEHETAPAARSEEGVWPRRALTAMRWWLPAAIAGVGVIIMIRGGGSGISFELAASFFGGGIAVLLANVLFRIGASGESDRRREEAARHYFGEHGRWPDEP
jgi:hypothetical protein